MNCNVVTFRYFRSWTQDLFIKNRTKIADKWHCKIYATFIGRNSLCVSYAKNKFNKRERQPLKKQTFEPQ